MVYNLIETHRCFDGTQNVYSHWSEANQCVMRFGLYLPLQSKTSRVPVLYWLSGLTCTEQNFITKAGAQRVASELGVALVVPDTSPRDVTKGERNDNVGEGAGFYVDATEEPWRAHYQMYTYISQELPQFINQHFPVDPNRCGLFGHSMGGHGALVIGLRNPDRFHSLSAFAPISSVRHAPWASNALTHYLGAHQKAWLQYDACYLLEKNHWPHGEILIDQGAADPFLDSQLKPQLLNNSAMASNNSLLLRMQPDYDHSYYFITAFIEEHIRFHAQKWC